MCMSTVCCTGLFNLDEAGSVEETKPGNAARLDRLEADMQHRLMTMDIHGGMNIREENKRGRNRTLPISSVSVLFSVKIIVCKTFSVKFSRQFPFGPTPTQLKHVKI